MAIAAGCPYPSRTLLPLRTATTTTTIPIGWVVGGPQPWRLPSFNFMYFHGVMVICLSIFMFCGCCSMFTRNVSPISDIPFACYYCVSLLIRKFISCSILTWTIRMCVCVGVPVWFSACAVLAIRSIPCLKYNSASFQLPTTPNQPTNQTPHLQQKKKYLQLSCNWGKIMYIHCPPRRPLFCSCTGNFFSILL